MTKRFFLSCFVALAVCGTSFYLAYFAGLLWVAASGHFNPVNDFALQWWLRHLALPVSVVLGLVAFGLGFRRFARSVDSQRSSVKSERL